MTLACRGKLAAKDRLDAWKKELGGALQLYCSSLRLAADDLSTFVPCQVSLVSLRLPPTCVPRSPRRPRTTSASRRSSRRSFRGCRTRSDVPSRTYRDPSLTACGLAFRLNSTSLTLSRRRDLTSLPPTFETPSSPRRRHRQHASVCGLVLRRLLGRTPTYARRRPKSRGRFGACGSGLASWVGQTLTISRRTQ